LGLSSGLPADIGEWYLGNVGEVLEIKLFLCITRLLLLFKLSSLMQLEREGADWPKAELLIKTRFDKSDLFAGFAGLAISSESEYLLWPVSSTDLFH